MGAAWVIEFKQMSNIYQKMIAERKQTKMIFDSNNNFNTFRDKIVTI